MTMKWIRKSKRVGKFGSIWTYECPICAHIADEGQLEQNKWTCPSCGKKSEACDA